jgi:nucleoside-diphosphate-sugar epimerase
MARKTVLIAGASGLVGYAAMKHFGGDPDCDATVVSRRKPDETFGARFIAADLTDRARSAEIFGAMRDVTHVVFAALYEKPGALIAGWRDDEQISTNDAMLRNLMDPLEKAARGLRHVSLLQGTKAYGAHVRPIASPAREDRDEARDVPNFYWNQQDYLSGLQRGKDWCYTIFRPVLIFGFSIGGAMNLIPALGTYAALMRADGHTALPFPGGPGRISQAVDADLLARAMAWAGEAPQARNSAINVTNGDVYTWPGVWPAICRAVGMEPGPAEPRSFLDTIAPREADWARICREHGLVSPSLRDFVGLSFEYADFQLGYRRTKPGPPSIVSTIRLHQSGFHEVMDTECMLTKWFRIFQDKRLLPKP